MTRVFTARRRTEDFNNLVEGGSTAATGSRFDDQLALVALLRDLPDPEPREEFTADLRERLMTAADTLLVPSEETQRLTLPSRQAARDRRVAAVVGGLAVVGATASLAVAAQSALPGDMLYPVKRVIEHAQTQFHSSDDARGQAMLGNATDRLTEATTLSRDGDPAEGDHVAEALVDFADQATVASDLLLADYDETGDEAPVQGLRDFTAASLQTLTELESVLPDEARDELQYAVQVLDEIDDAAARACPACRGGISQIPPSLLSAGSVTEPTVVVVPDPLVPGTSFQSGSGQHDGGQGKGGKKGDGGGGNGGQLPDVELPASAGGAGNGNGSSGGGGGPLSTLTEGLTGKGGGKSSGSGGGGLTGVPEVDDTVDGVVEDLDDLLPDLP